MEEAEDKKLPSTMKVNGNVNRSSYSILNGYTHVREVLIKFQHGITRVAVFVNSFDLLDIG